MTARRGSVIGRAVVAVLLAAGGWGLVTSAASGSPTPRPRLDGTYLPAHRPVGYRSAEPSGTATDGVGSTWREVTLEPVDLGSRPLVDICTGPARHSPCPVGDERVLRHVGPVAVSVALTGGSGRARRAAAAYWRTVRLVRAERLGWPTGVEP